MASALERQKVLTSVWPLLLLLSALYAPSLRLPFEADEYLILGAVEGTSPWMGKPWDAYQFSSGKPAEVEEKRSGGQFPWYTDPTFRYRLWRPLASVVLWGESRLFSARAGYQVDSLLCYGVLVAIVFALWKRVAPGPLGLIAAWIFALAPLHVEPVAWLSARHVLLGQTLGIAGLWALIRGHEQRAWSRWVVPTSLFGLAFFFSESGLQPLGYVVAWWLFGDEGPRRERLRSVAPVLAAAVAYFVLYRALGRGAVGMGYVDPLQSPIALLMSGLLQHRVVSMLGQLATGFEHLDPVTLALVLCGAAWAVARALPRLQPAERATVSWLLGGALLSLLPALPGYPEPRMLLCPGVGAAGALAAIAVAAWRSAQVSSEPRKVVAALWIVAVGILHGLAPLVRVPALLRARDAHDRLSLESMTSPTLTAGGAHDVRVLACDNWLLGQLGGYVRPLAGGTPVSSWQLLTEGPLTLQLRRTGAQTFELLPSGAKSFRQSFFRNAFRYPLRTDDRFEQGGMRVRVLDANERGEATRLSFTLPASLDDSRWAFARCTGEPLERLERVVMPAVGGEVTL